MTKLLVIDDDINTCDLLQKFLAKHGFTVVTTTTAKKAMEYLDDIRDFNLVVCDLRLENGDGKDILLKARELFPKLPVVIITGYNDLKTAVDIMKLGAYDYILKPLIPEDMLATINNALNDESVNKEKQLAQPVSMPEE